MRLDGSDINPGSSKPAHVRLDLISRTAGSALWWVALQFEDGTRRPEGMFTDPGAARTLAGELAGSLGVAVVEEDFTS